jgi:SAM-dependent methyltransferase
VVALAERYSADAKAYRDLWAPVLRPYGTRLLGRVPLARAKRILDVGTGVGALLPEIKKAAPSAHIFGIDRSSGMVALAPRSYLLAAMDAERLALRSSTFDIAVIAFVLFHLPDPVKALAEISRVLRPGGTIGVVTWGEGWDVAHPALRAWEEELDAHGADAATPVLDHKGAMDSSEKMEALLRAAGYASPEVWIDQLEYRWNLEKFIRRQLSMGLNRRRFESIDPERQRAFLAVARRRLELLDPESLVHRSKLVYATATTPA